MGHRIQNFETLALNDLRTDALSIAEAGFAAIDVGAALERKLRIENNELRIAEKTYSLAERRIFFIGVGKCAFAGATAIERILGDKLTGGIALDVSSANELALKKIEVFVGTHPLPTEVNETATKRIVEFLAERRESDLVIILISGGGSTLLSLHELPMTCLDESMLFQELTAKGATIQDINVVRKHISVARGGALAKAAYPAEVLSLIVSDVPENDIGFIASGPTVMDSSTIENARALITHYGVAIPLTTAFIETPKDPKYFERVTNVLFLTNQDALTAMKEEAEKRGYAVTVEDDHFTGESLYLGRAITRKLHDAAPKTALLYAGESTVTISANVGGPSPRRSGLRPREGGRNQEMALAALADVRPGELVLPFASDGHDNTTVAGAIADEMTRAHVFRQNMSMKEFLEAHRSYDFFATTGDALHTGYTGTNVSDLIIALKK